MIGRLILAFYWLHAAYGHIFSAKHMVGYAQSKGVKSPMLAIVGSGVLALIGGLSLLLGVATTWGIAALVVFLIGVSFKMHPYWKEQDPMAKMGDRIQFWKNMAILGGLLAMLAIPMPWPWAAF